jgi:hypothetical protein
VQKNRERERGNMIGKAKKGNKERGKIRERRGGAI